MTTVTLIQDRIYAINLTVAAVNASRTFKGAPDSAELPMLTCLVGKGTRNVNQVGIGQPADAQTRTFRLLLLVEAWMSGIPTETAQLAAEELIDTIQEAYLRRPRLELGDDDPLDGVSQVRLQEDSGIIAFGPLAAIEFPLMITYRKTI